MVNPLNDPQVRDAAGFAWVNFPQAIANTGKGVLTAQCGNRIGSGAFKATKDFGRGDLLCGTLCSLSMRCEAACVWLPIPGKFCTIGILKGVSYGSTKFQDLCSVDPSSPFCD